MMLHIKSLAFLILLATMILPLTAFQPLKQESLDIKIKNVGKKSGKIVIEIYNTKTSWLKSAYRKMVLSANLEFQTASFLVPYGKYSVSVYKDINNNDKLDMGIFSIPKEPIGFGNNYRPFGNPKYESASIEFNATSKTHQIKLFTVF